MANILATVLVYVNNLNVFILARCKIFLYSSFLRNLHWIKFSIYDEVFIRQCKVKGCKHGYEFGIYASLVHLYL